MRLSKLFVTLLVPAAALALGQPRYVETSARPGSFAIAQGKTCAPIYVGASEYAGVARAAGDLAADIARVTGCTPAVVRTTPGAGARGIVIGTVEKSAVVSRLVDTSGIAGKWETFATQTAGNALVIAGSDKRGAIYGIYDLSEQMGVSPWYWWADVPVAHRDAVYVKPGRYSEGEPAVKYRGIFLNDEAPALSGWTHEKFGGFKHEFYAKVFELILRLKGNYLWPAMWGSAFNEDDPMNPKLADEYGIVMGTSHHEPMLRAQQEWKRHGKGPWNYATNADVLDAFWDAGIERNKDYESIVTLGMRGDGDMPMDATGGMEANKALLERIVAEQREILAKRIGPDLAKIPQDWALYKEVQDYYDAGMRVPDDVTLLWCDDNWGNLRRVPTSAERKRAGGAGIYYHFDYVGGPRNYKWLNTNPIAKVWEQMNIAYQYDARRIWIVNVGDLKPMEFPIEYFLSLAWNPQRWPSSRIDEFGRLWAAREFGPAHAAEIADIMAKYTKYNGRRKPELLEPGTFSLENYDEAARVENDWKALTKQAEAIYQALPSDARDAFFELVLYPVRACDIVNELYIAAARNRLYVRQGRASANDYAARVRELFQADADWSATYNHKLAGGKWDHMMDQTHIGYTYWQQPDQNNMPAVTEIPLPEAAALGVSPAALDFDSFTRSRREIEIFNRGRAAFDFTAVASAPWIVAGVTHGNVRKDARIPVTVDWARVPAGNGEGTVKISGAGGEPVTVKISAFNPREVTRDNLRGFVEAGGYVSIEASHYTDKTDTAAARWELIPDLGRTLSSMTIAPSTAPSVESAGRGPSLSYGMYLFDPGEIRVSTMVAPTLHFVPGRGLRYAVAFDEQTPQIVDMLAKNTLHDWEESVKDSVRVIVSTHKVKAPGYHTLKYWMVDPGVVLEKIVVDLGGLKPSYLGPPESYRSVPIPRSHTSAAGEPRSAHY